VRGRDTEWGLVTEVLRRSGKKRGGVILVEGEPGIGKSLLLAEAGRTARREGYSLVAGAANGFEWLIPLCPLRVALGEAAEVPAENEFREDRDVPPLRLIAAVRDRLESMAAGAPVLVTMDDLQDADPLTLLALRMLPRRLAARPIVWILARTTQARATEHDSDAARLFDMLDDDGAVRIRLRALPDAAVAELVTDLSSAVPDGGLLSLAEDTGGNPSMVRELLYGLAEENALRISAGRAVLLSARVPARLRALIRRQLDVLLPQTRQLLETAAILGKSFALEDAAEMLGQPPAALLPAVDEALGARILVSDGELLSFSHVPVWHTVRDALPESVTRALHRHFGEILLDRGRSARQAAEHLLRGARHGDPRALHELDQAAGEVLRSAPGTAADLAMRVLELTDPGDPARVDRSLAAVRALTAARRLEEAVSLIGVTLDESPRAVPRSRLRCVLAAILNMTGRPDRAHAEAESVLAEPYLPDSVRDEATVVLLQALVELPDMREAEERAAAILADPASSGRLVVAAIAAQAAIKWNEGLVAESLTLSYEAISGKATGEAPDTWTFRPALDLASRLADLRQFDEAVVLVATPPRDPDAISLAEAQARPALLRARMYLAAGDLDRAEAEVQAVDGDEQQAGLSLGATFGPFMHGVIALRRGDLNGAERVLNRIFALPDEARSGHIGVHCLVLAARVAESRDGAAQALALVTGIYDNIDSNRWLLLADPAAAPWLVRLALTAGDRARAAKAGAVADHLRRVNSAFPVVAAGCAHAVGLLGGDVDLLRLAAETQTDLWSSASAAEDLGVLYADQGRIPDAIACLERARDGYEQYGAARDTARVRQRLRGLGVARRPFRGAERPLAGLASLTETERGIADLVAQGLTNRRIADQLFISAHTVAFHLRQIFRKLSIASRVELTRLIMEQHRGGRSQSSSSTY
jgi:DNA-binding CsgD family transcriptional regulator